MFDDAKLEDARDLRWGAALPAVPAAADRDPLRRASFALRSFALHDWVALGYLMLVPLALWLTPASETRARIISHHITLLVSVAACIAVARAEPRRTAASRQFWISVIYRLALVASMLVTYLLLGDALPLLNTRALDHQLYHLDLALFGFEPAVLMERWATPAVTDWFALFYVGYFGLLAFFVLPIVFLGKSKRLGGELAVVTMLTFGIGQTVYALVPGFGPIHALPQAFHGPLHGRALFNLMNAIVSRGGAQKDIFPSLHTAVPVALTLLAFRHRRGRVMRWAWPVIAFVTVNIVIATMFLRWHYLVDVIAGLCLAVFSVHAAGRISEWEINRRRAAGLGDLWPGLPVSKQS